MKELFHTILFAPLYNGLVFLIDVVPGGSVGLAVILLTIVVKLILFPLSAKAVRAQIQMKIIQKPMAEIREKFKDNREAMGRAMLDLYKKYKINPFSGIAVLFVQIPIIIALYLVFLNGGLPTINTEWLYSFVPVPTNVDMHFFGLGNIGVSGSILLALLVGISQYFQARFSFPKPEPRNPNAAPNLQDDIARGMQIQVKYVLPVFIAFISYSLISVVSIYWIVSNLFSIGQELYMRSRIKKPEEERVHQRILEGDTN